MEEGEMSNIGKSKKKEGEVDYKSKSGTAWSHSYLNQKPWHPLSYPNQRRKWIAEQTHANSQRRADEVAREYAQEQEFFRQSSLVSNSKDKEKMEIMRAVSFMYVRPPGYDAESARAAEIADQSDQRHDKPRPKDVFGRSLPSEEDFHVLKNAPRLETGVAGRVKPFGVEVRNVKCLRCGNYGHQSGDRECPLKDAIMPNEHTRLKRDDPLSAILAHTDGSEPPKWELKQKPGISPPRGGFNPDDPNQQIVAEEEIFDEYGGFLNGGDIPELLSNFSSKPKKKSRKKSTHKTQQSSPNSKEFEDDFSSPSTEGETRSQKRKHRKKNKKKKKRNDSASSSSDDSESHRYSRNRKHERDLYKESERGRHHSRSTEGRKRSNSSVDFKDDRYRRSDDNRRIKCLPTKESETERHRHGKKPENLHHSYNDKQSQSTSKGKERSRYSNQQSDPERQHGRRREQSRSYVDHGSYA